MTCDPHEFYDDVFRFSIRKPASWRFVPAAWSPATVMKNADPASSWRKHANDPFVCFMGSHDSDTEAYPTVQVGARPAGVLTAVPTSAEADDMLQKQMEFMAQQFRDFDALEWSSSNIICGRRASMLRARFTLVAGDDDADPLSVLGRMITIYTPGVTFNIGMSSSDNPQFYSEEEFDTILSSIAIGHRS